MVDVLGMWGVKICVLGIWMAGSEYETDGVTWVEGVQMGGCRYVLGVGVGWG